MSRLRQKGTAEQHRGAAALERRRHVSARTRSIASVAAFVIITALRSLSR
jgi:hypothetical protein